MEFDRALAPYLLLATLLSIALTWLMTTTHGFTKKKKAYNIPPGSMGWPLLGETMAFTKHHAATSLGDFLETRIKRYGKVFSTRLLGSLAIVSADPELTRFVLLNDSRLFEPAWTKSMVRILGKWSMIVNTGDTHRFLKNIPVYFLAPARLSEHFLGVSEDCALQVLDSWEEGNSFSAADEACKHTFNLIVKKILGLESDDHRAVRIREAYKWFRKGFVSMPINLPGFAYRKSILARETILKIIEQVREERVQMRKDGQDKIGDDFLGVTLENPELTPEQVGDLVVGLLFGGHETSSGAIGLGMYFLSGCPKALEQLREESIGIARKKRERGETRLTWEDYKQMEFTHCVVTETLRLGNVARYLLRRATVDTQFKGYDIPRGCLVMPVFSTAHLDNDVYKDAHCFDPWRWQNMPAGAMRPEDYMPFSLGVHKCAGMDLAKMEIAVFLHYLVLKYDWELVDGREPLTYFGAIEFHNGLQVKVRRALSP